ncbi:MAG: serine-type D-Ala-D-Ala carboxypeptidase, partial [Spirochaetia bacterium]
SEKVDTLRSSAVVDEPLEAPIQEGEVVGKVLVSSGSENLREYPISASRTVEEGGALRRAWDSLRVRLSEF